MKKTGKISIRSMSLIALFSLVIYAPFLDIFFETSAPPLVSENRKLAEKPKLDVHKLDIFPPQFEAWFNDHFHFRNNLIILDSYIKGGF